MDGAKVVKIIETRLAELGMQKKTFYELTGVSSASFSQWRTGITQPSPDALRRINAALGTSFEIKSSLSDGILDSVKMLQELRDEDRALLEVVRDMTPAQVEIMAEFGRTLKRIERKDTN